MYTKFKIINLSAVVLLSGLMLSLSLPKKPETWHDAPDKSTSKIRLVTHLEKNALQKRFIVKMLQQGMSVDTTGMLSYAGHLWSTVWTSDGYYVHFLCETTDSIETISGEAGDRGLNDPGKPASATNIGWTKIVYNKRGWLDLNMFAQIDSAVIQYNSTR